MPLQDIVALGDRHKEIVDAIGEQQSTLPMALSALSRPSNFSVQRRVVAAFRDKSLAHPLTHDFKITLDEAVSNVIDVSLDECIVPLVRHNVFAGDTTTRSILALCMALKSTAVRTTSRLRH